MHNNVTTGNVWGLSYCASLTYFTTDQLGQWELDEVWLFKTWQFLKGATMCIITHSQ